MDSTSPLLIEPHYCGSLEYYLLITESDAITWEVEGHFLKQTFRNRTTILSANGPQNLVVPVKYRNHMPLKDVRIDYAQGWIKDHWGALYSAYGKAPYFEYYGPELLAILEKRHAFLVDLCHATVTLCLKYLQIDRSISLTEVYEKVPNSPIRDFRDLIHPKKPYTQRSIYNTVEYFQNFGKEFVPCLSVLDLLFSMGDESVSILRKSKV